MPVTEKSMTRQHTGQLSRVTFFVAMKRTLPVEKATERTASWRGVISSRDQGDTCENKTYNI
jgi:hypothetical protein